MDEKSRLWIKTFPHGWFFIKIVNNMLDVSSWKWVLNLSFKFEKSQNCKIKTRGFKLNLPPPLSKTSLKPFEVPKHVKPHMFGQGLSKDQGK